MKQNDSGLNYKITQGPELQTIERKPPTVAISPVVAREIAYRWSRLGQTTRSISRRLSIHNREAVEVALMQQLTSGPLPVIPVPGRSIREVA